MIALYLISFFCILIYYVYYLSKKDFDYWEKRDIPYIKPWPLVGNYGPYILLQEYFGSMVQALCKIYPFAPYIGVFHGINKALIVQDPEIIKLIMTKDFYHFHSRENSKYAHKETFVNSLFFSSGDKWKVVRQNVTPVFSSAKMKTMFGFVKSCARLFEKALDEENRKENVEMRSFFIRFTLDITGNCLFGIDTKTFEKDWQTNPFLRVANSIFETSKIRGAKTIGRTVYPKIFYGLGLKNFPLTIDAFFKNYLRDLFKGDDTIKNRGLTELLTKMNTERALTGDTMENIQEANTKKKYEIDDFTILSQCVGLFGGGFDSSASVTTFTLYEIAKHPKVQERAIQEIDDYLKRHDNKLMFDCLSELPYVEACIEESLRLYPSVSVLRREVMVPYTLPCGAVLDKGVRIHIPVYHLHRDAKFFPNPEEFQPERFLGENKHNIQPYTYLPFGEGPRMCLGNRFAKMQMIPGIVTVLKRFWLEVPPNMPKKLELLPTSLLTQPTEKIKLTLVDREGWEQRKFA